MNKTIKGLMIAAVAVATGCCSCNDCDCRCRTEKEPNISVFASFIRKMAKERNISLAEAADMLYAIGVRGYDCGTHEKDIDELAATRLKAVNFYVFPNMFAPDGGRIASRFWMRRRSTASRGAWSCRRASPRAAIQRLSS